jgi:hypothetical protein
VLVGTTVDAERVRDIAVAVDVLVARSDAKEPATPIILAGAGRFGVLAAYAALVSDRVSGLVLRDPPATHMDAAAPQLLDVLRTVDVPDLLGLLAPRPLVVATDLAERFERTRRIYAAAEAEQHLHLRPLARD